MNDGQGPENGGMDGQKWVKSGDAWQFGSAIQGDFNRLIVLVWGRPVRFLHSYPEEPIEQSAAGQAGDDQPCDCVRSPIENNGLPSERRLCQWIRAHGRIAALAYISDNYFTGTAFRVHNAFRFSNRDSQHPMLESSKAADKKDLVQYAQALAREEMEDNTGTPRNNKQVEMMVTLNHTMFFHNPRDL
ncbi:hypothetical protein K432DRAFT_398044 [Lepidopterella palustris CBS 459.81]|uniref:Acyl-CoA thioesterase-like C-terminal domain-containing protein n=1 Tax=Lepidopterella palustris CBS 459.81 TaxID=1314670 RepID=A0A8E2JA70_9PEZI|nr:hypothetical protein K432DRAFT_398044 [Lepidopterella palustris CBS 459.81]